jgi:steroid 5-alpha reductase family enzyme
MWTELAVFAAWTCGGCCAIMFLLWCFATAKKDASVVDVAWAGLLGCIAIASAVFASGLPARRLMIGLMGGIWGVRLTSYLLWDRVLKAKHEDGRYQELRAKWGEHANRNFFVFFQAQGLLAALLGVPFMMAAFTNAPLGVLDFVAIGVWCIGIVGESIADRQLASWRRDAGNAGKTCRAGLWRYSRHPNYFFEWLMWCSYAIAAMSFPLGFVAWAAPALMLLLILKVTGIPPTEARALRTRGDDYRRYQQETSAFVPWFPKTSK